MSPPAELSARVRAVALDLGFDAVVTGPVDVAADGERLRAWLADGRHGTMDWMARTVEARADPATRYPGVRSVVAVALSHDPGTVSGAEPVPDDGVPRGFIARYARGRDYHRVMETRLKRIKAILEDEGPEGTRAWWAVDHGPVLDRALARSAGLGFFGKSTSLIRPGLGSYFVLGEVLTTAELVADEVPAGSCGTCTACIDACPTGAITGPGELDARRCISYLTIELDGPIPEEWRPALGAMVFGCDICQEVCPWNRFAQPVSVDDLRPRELAAAPDLTALADLDEAGWDAAFRGMAVRRAGFRGLRRNVAVALGNSGDEAARPALERLAACGDPLVEEHARWGIKRLDG